MFGFLEKIVPRDRSLMCIAFAFVLLVQTATGSPLAALYNDQTPLEHHHLAVTLQILRREDCDILGHLDKTDRVS